VGGERGRRVHHLRMFLKGGIMRIPKCQVCGKSDMVIRATYGTKDFVYEEDWECERCYVVVKVIKDYVNTEEVI
jgi:hypothetical protein